MQAETGNPDAARVVVDYLVGERLLTVRTDPEDLTKSMIDLSHEALIQHWDRLRGWLAEDPHGRAMREEFRKACDQWVEGIAGVPHRSRHGLPGSDLTNAFLMWVDNAQPKLGPVQHEFAQTLREMLARQRRVRRTVLASLAGLTLASLVLAIFAYFQTSKAKTNENLAITRESEAKDSEKKARASETRAKIESAALAHDTGFQLCVQGRIRIDLIALNHSLQICSPGVVDESVDEDTKAAARGAAKLRKVILTNLAAWGTNLMCLDVARSFPGQAVATDGTGRYILMQNPDTTVQLFEIDSGQPVEGTFHPLSSPQPSLLAIILHDARVLIYGPEKAAVWNPKTGQRVGPEIHHGSQGPATLSPDAKWVATGSTTGEVALWNTESGHQVGKSWLHQDKIYSLAFTPDGKQLVTGCGRRPDARDDKPGTVQLFGLDKPEPIWKRDDLKSPPTAVAISLDGKVVAGCGYDSRRRASAMPSLPRTGLRC